MVDADPPDMALRGIGIGDAGSPGSGFWLLLFEMELKDVDEGSNEGNDQEAEAAD